MIGKMNLAVSLNEYGTISLPLREDLSLADNDYIQGRLSITKEDNLYIIYAHIECVKYPYDYFRSFSPEHSLELEIPMQERIYQALAIEKYNPFWTTPVFFDNEKGENGRHIQQLLLKVGNKYIHIMPVSDEHCTQEIGYEAAEKAIRLFSNCHCVSNTKINGAIALFSESDDPYKAIEANYTAAYKHGIIKTPLKREKHYPQQLEGLGWCTWNAFYHEVTEDGIEKKLIELREKGIRLDWLIIDDGWSVVRDFKLQDLKEDRNKFPSGLRIFIKKLKKEYGVRYVGVWHAFTGYWFGIDKDSELYQEQKENLVETDGGLILPAGEYEKAYAFYSTWHKYLREQGVDFLKVDAQGNASEFYRGLSDGNARVIAMHEAIERSVKENFGGAMINCMGLGNLDAYWRNTSAVVRNSDDFFPEKQDGFRSHIEQNAYNAVFNSRLYYCDYDMWWTKHVSAKQSSVLRAISGGPVYISDKVGETEVGYIKQLLNEDGSITRYEEAARPTFDCLFGYDKVIKLFNYKYENGLKKYIIGLFNISDEAVCITFRVSDVVPDSNNSDGYTWIVNGQKIGGNDHIQMEIGASDVEVFCLVQ